MRDQMFTTPRFALTSLLLVGAIVLAMVPLSGRISLPAVLQSPEYTAVFAPEAGRIREVLVAPGQTVSAGEVLLVLESPEIASQTAQARLRLDSVDLRLARSAADQEERDNMHVLLRSWKTESTKLAGLSALEERLVIRAPIDGRVTRLDDALHPGRWINPQLRIANIISDGQVSISALTKENSLRFIEPGMEARFYPEDARRPALDAHVTEVATTDSDGIDLPYLASLYGGDIAVRRDEEGKLVAEESVFRIRLAPREGEPTATRQAQRGVVHIAGEPRSLASAAFESVAAVLVRESGF